MRLEEIISRRSQCLHDIWTDTCCLDGTSITCCGPNVISSSRSRRYNRDKKLVVACSALQAQLKLVVALQAFTTSELCVTRLVVGPVWCTFRISRGWAEVLWQQGGAAAFGEAQHPKESLRRSLHAAGLAVDDRGHERGQD